MKTSEKKEYLRKTGDLSSLYGIKNIICNEGRAKGVQAYSVKNGKNLNFTVFVDRGLDIPFLEFKEHNIGFLSKSGISSPFSYTYTRDGADCFLRQFSGGFLTTCGMTFAGAFCEENEKELPLHGRVSNTIAENTYTSQVDENDEVVLRICGDVRESRIFGENMVLHRELKVYTERNRIVLCDVVENRGFQPQPVMMIYHVNFGYPMLDTGTRMYFSADKVEAQTEFAQKGIALYDLVEEPEVEREEQCYYHFGQENPCNSFALIHNEKLGIAVVVKYNAEQCPILCEWKSMQAGDFAVGLEPTTSGTKGRVVAREKGWVKELEAQTQRKFDLEFLFLDNIEEIKKWQFVCKEYKK